MARPGPWCLPILAAAAGCAGPQPAGPRHYECRFTSHAVIIDGRLDEPAWEGAAWTEPFVDIEGGDRPAPRLVTGARMLWDDEHLYIGAVMEEPDVWADLTEHDQVVYHDNDFEVFIDPDGDGDLYFEIEVNARNTIFDLFLVRPYSAGGPALHDWDLKGLDSAVDVAGTLNDPSDTDRGWSVEMAIPWEALRPGAADRQAASVAPRPGDTWRINFSRVQWEHRVAGGRYEKLPDTPESNWVWSPQGVVNMHVPGRWGFVRFVRPPA